MAGLGDGGREGGAVMLVGHVALNSSDAGESLGGGAERGGLARVDDERPAALRERVAGGCT